MNDDLIARLLASPYWRWMPGGGFRDHVSGATYRHTDDGATMCVGAPDTFPTDGGAYVRALAAGPVRDDPATLGCMLALAREAWGDAELHTVPITWDRGPEWVASGSEAGGSLIRGRGPSEFEALAEAIIAAPAKKTSDE